MKTSGISAPDGILVLADILSGKLTARDAAPAVASADRTAGRGGTFAIGAAAAAPVPVRR